MGSTAWIWVVVGILLLLLLLVLSSGKKTSKKSTDSTKPSLKERMKVGDKTPAGSFLKWAIPCLMIFATLWAWDEFGAKLQGKGTEPIWQTMYPWTGEITQESLDSELLNPPGENFPVWIEIVDPSGKADWNSLDLTIVGYMSEKEMPPQKYNPTLGLEPDLNAYDSYRVFLGEKSEFKSLRRGVIQVRMDMKQQWIGPQASDASVRPL